MSEHTRQATPADTSPLTILMETRAIAWVIKRRAKGGWGGDVGDRETAIERIEMDKK